MKNTIRIHLLLLFLCFFIFPVYSHAQVEYDRRLEIELKDGYEKEQIISFGEQGFIMRSRGSKASQKEYEWKYELFDTDLTSVDEQSIYLAKKMRLDESYHSDDRTHTLFKDKSGNYSLISVAAQGLEIQQIDGNLPKNAWISDMAVMGDYAFFQARIGKRPFLLSIHWKTGASNFIPIELRSFKPKDLSMQDFQVLEDAREVMVYVRAKVNKKEGELYVIRLNDQGKNEESFLLSKEFDRNIISVSASRVEEGNYIFSGTYSSKNKSVSEGLFLCQRLNKKLQFIEYHNYLDLQDFLTYLPAKRKKKVEKKQKKKEAKGKEFKINYRIAAHNMIKLQDGYIFLGEAFYPTYRTESYQTTTTVNGVTTTTTNYRSIFDGYQYTHAVITKFDFEGKLIWDKTFHMWPAYKPFWVKKFISIDEQNAELMSMVYASRSRIFSKTVHYDDGEVVQNEESDIIDTGYEGDKYKRSFSNIDYWYNNHFLAFGSQVIKNKADEEVKRKRKVYFISKVSY